MKAMIAEEKKVTSEAEFVYKRIAEKFGAAV